MAAAFLASRRASAYPPASLDERAALERRREAAALERLERVGRRDARDVMLDEQVTGVPEASGTAAGSDPLDAIDGDPLTAWRGAKGASSWVFTATFRRVVHVGLVRLYLGDSAERGVPAAFRIERQLPVEGRCEPWALWQLVPGGARDDRDGNTFAHGPREVHAQRQALFADVDACGLRLVVDAVDGDEPPVLRELHVHESAPSVLRRPGTVVETTGGPPCVEPSSPAAVVDGTYEGLWAGARGAGRWSLTARLARPALVDRLALVLGHDAVTVARSPGPGRSYAGAHLPTRYAVSTSPDDDPSHFVPLREADPPARDGATLPVRRRVVPMEAPRWVKVLRLDVDEATGPWGERGAEVGAPVVREIALFEADDPRPAMLEPSFLSVDANPAGLTSELEGGEAQVDGVFARDAYHRLRRVLLGFDADSRWPADASRPREAGTGRFLEVVEGDDPTLESAFLQAISPPPTLLLSGGLDWEFEPDTAASPRKKGHWGWDAAAHAASRDRGMGQLREAVQRRHAPMVGFCGGAQILALLEAAPSSPRGGVEAEQAHIDAVLLRNENRPIRGLLTRKNPYERAWWSDPPGTDVDRPIIFFDRRDALFDAALGSTRASTLELPSSHGDMLRASAFTGPLSRLRMVSHSDYCRPWVAADGPEPTWVDPTDAGRRCVRVPQAFRSIDPWAYPVMGFQFHPEQRDLQRLGAGSPSEARGDALNVVANAVDLVLQAYLRLHWPWS